MLIRDALPSEAALLSALALESKAYWGYSQAFMDACKNELRVSELQLSSDSLAYRVLEIKNTLVGYYAIAAITEQLAELEALFVKPAFIGQGLGKALMQDAIVFCQKHGHNRLKIQGDPNAESFYLACGAKRIGQLESMSIKGRFLPLFHLDIPAKPAQKPQ